MCNTGHNTNNTAALYLNFHIKSKNGLTMTMYQAKWYGKLVSTAVLNTDSIICKLPDTLKIADCMSGKPTIALTRRSPMQITCIFHCQTEIWIINQNLKTPQKVLIYLITKLTLQLCSFTAIAYVLKLFINCQAGSALPPIRKRNNNSYS